MNKFQQYILPNILLGLLFILYFFIGFHRVSSTVPAILLIFFGLYHSFINKIDLITIFKKNTFIIALSFYFLISLFSYFQEPVIMDFIEKGKLKIFFFLIPLILFSLSNLIKTKIDFINKTIFFGSLISIFMYLIVALYKYNIMGVNAFLYAELVSISFVNPIIYSLYLNVALLIFYYKIDTKNYLIKHFILLFYGFIILILLSKIGIVVFLLSYVFILFQEYKKSFKKGLLLSLIFLVIIGLSTIFGMKNKTISKRFYQIKSSYAHLQNNNINQSFPRLAVLKSSKSIVNNNFLFGVGISNVKEELRKEFEKIDFKKGLGYGLDAHNQFLQTLLGSGIFGLLSLLAIYFYLFKTALENKDILLFHFSSILFIFSLVESIFESQMSVFIFLLFSFIIFFQSKNKKSLLQ